MIIYPRCISKLATQAPTLVIVVSKPFTLQPGCADCPVQARPQLGSPQMHILVRTTHIWTPLSLSLSLCLSLSISIYLSLSLSRPLSLYINTVSYTTCFSTCTEVYMHVCVCISIYILYNVCVCIYICMYIYIYIKYVYIYICMPEYTRRLSDGRPNCALEPG